MTADPRRVIQEDIGFSLNSYRFSHLDPIRAVHITIVDCIGDNLPFGAHQPSCELTF